MNRPVFSNPDLEDRFQQNGYVEVPLLSSNEVEDLKSAFFESLPRSEGHLGPADERVKSAAEITYDFTFIDRSIGYKQEVFNIISKAFEKKSAEYLKGYVPIIANYIRKKPENGEVPLHQNWAFVDEQKCTSVSIWCPLVDSTENNGTLQVVPGSHKRFGAVRGPMIRSELEDIKQHIIERHLKPLPTKAGQAVILDDSLVHYSAINRTEGLRLAIQLILIPEEESSIHYHMDPSVSQEHVEVLHVDRDFYMRFNPWKKPDKSLRRLHSLKHRLTSLTADEFSAQLAGPRFDTPAAKPGFWSKLTSSFKLNAAQS